MRWNMYNIKRQFIMHAIDEWISTDLNFIDGMNEILNNFQFVTKDEISIKKDVKN